MNVADPNQPAGFYEVAAPGDLVPVRLAIHLEGDPAAFTARLRAVAAQLEPTLLVIETVPLSDVFSEELWGARWMTFLFGVLAAIAMVLSLASLYALMSFTVSERTREIGIRTALGASRGRVLRAIATRAFIQLLAGVVLGTLVVYVGATSAQMASEETVRNTSWVAVLGGVSAVMMAVGLLSCLAPTLRGLRIQPGEALRER